MDKGFGVTLQREIMQVVRRDLSLVATTSASSTGKLGRLADSILSVSVLASKPEFDRGDRVVGWAVELQAERRSTHEVGFESYMGQVGFPGKAKEDVPVFSMERAIPVASTGRLSVKERLILWPLLKLGEIPRRHSGGDLGFIWLRLPVLALAFDPRQYWLTAWGHKGGGIFEVSAAGVLRLCGCERRQYEGGSPSENSNHVQVVRDKERQASLVGKLEVGMSKVGAIWKDDGARGTVWG
ncbi:hypothetical protein BKA70DRAFT_1239269 [Coprinopsis sp. MPI-PUGE-AT-0042]|nr:hypothetical protein BKA70DRAFT_1239269 [Coprinopsis sp. MPI-PUGE-AT-0042]